MHEIWQSTTFSNIRPLSSVLTNYPGSYLQKVFLGLFPWTLSVHIWPIPTSGLLFICFSPPGTPFLIIFAHLLSPVFRSFLISFFGWVLAWSNAVQIWHLRKLSNGTYHSFTAYHSREGLLFTLLDIVSHEERICVDPFVCLSKHPKAYSKCWKIFSERIIRLAPVVHSASVWNNLLASCCQNCNRSLESWIKFTPPTKKMKRNHFCFLLILTY